MILTNIAFSQLSDGKYSYANNEITLSFFVRKGGTELRNVRLIDNYSKETHLGSGNWFSVNLNGAGPDYSGPVGWYQFQTQYCNFDFELDKEDLILNQFDCKNKRSSKKIILKSKK